MAWSKILNQISTRINVTNLRKHFGTARPLTWLKTNHSTRSSKSSDPEHSGRIDNLLLQGITFAKQGDLPNAEILLLQAEAQQPNDSRVLSALGNIAALRGNYGDAEARYRSALELDPSDPTLHANLGNALRELGRYNEAILHLDSALSFQPRFAMAYHNKALCLKSLKQLDQAMSNFQIGLSIDPSLLASLRGIIEVLHSRRQYEAATKLVRGHIAQGSSSAEAHFLLGLTLYFQELFFESERELRTSVEIDARHAEAWDTLGIVLQETGHVDAAIDMYTKSLESSPSAHAPRWHRAMAYLLCENFLQGWEDYEYRPPSASKPNQCDLPLWDGRNNGSTRLLIYPEQGIGDEIMFASCIENVSEMVGSCSLICSPKLEPLFRRSFANVDVRSNAHPVLLTDATAIAPIGSLPLHCRPNVESFPKRDRYLYADTSRISHWRHELAALGTGLKIGISWTGGTATTRRTRRSIPLHEWLPIFRLPNTHFISLQYTECQTELTTVRDKYGVEIHHWSRAISNYDETAALVSALDVVVSVQTALVHLCGALGQRAWVLVPIRPEWRYGRSGNKMVWYTTVTILRQSDQNSWTSTMEHMARILRNGA